MSLKQPLSAIQLPYTDHKIKSEKENQNLKGAIL